MTIKVQDKEFMFTGKLSMTRATAQSMVVRAGGIVGSSVNKNTDYLVVGKDYGSKFAKALDYGIATISEDEFWALFAEDEEYEEPLTQAELKDIESNEVLRTCTTCNKEYKAWASSIDSGICPVCSLLQIVKTNVQNVPKCPHCNSDVLYVEDFKEYHCNLCGIWFAHPYASAARTVKHLCKMRTINETEGGYLRICTGCGRDGFVSYEEHQEMVDKYEQAPTLVIEWDAQKEIVRADIEAKYKARMDRIANLSPDEEAELQRLYEAEQLRHFKKLEKRRAKSST